MTKRMITNYRLVSEAFKSLKY